MYFFLIVGGGMALSILLIYQLCRLAHIEVKLCSLVLCAFLALAVNAIAIRLSPFLNTGHYIRLGLLVVAAATIVTLFNEKMLRREEEVAANSEKEILEAIKKPLPWEEVAEEPAKDTIKQIVEPLAAETPSKDKIDKINEEVKEGVKAEPIAEAIAAAEPPKNSEPVAIAPKPLQEKSPAAKPVESEQPTEQELERAAAAQLKIIARGKENSVAAEKESKAIAKEKTKELAISLAKEEKKAREEAIKKQRQEYREQADKLSTLDDILDHIYEVKDKSPLAAITAYEVAIDRYPTDDYTPFLVIELATIYREQGDYQGAINTYTDALKIPIIAKNETMVLEFKKNISYLKVVLDTLKANHLESVPFAKLSHELKEKIEAEFTRRLATNTMGE